MSSGCRRPARVRGCSRRPAARARAARDAVDDLEALLHPVAGGLLHARPGGVDDRERLLVGDVAGAPPRVDPRLEAALGLPQVADPGDDPLVEQGVADRARRVVRAQAAQERLLVELGGEDVRPEAGDPLVEARARVGHQLQHGAVDLGDELVAAADHQPRVARGRPVARRARATCRSCAGGSGSSARSRSAGTGACRGRRRSRPPGLRAAPASGRARSAGAAWRSRPGSGPRAPGGSCSPRSGWCRPRAPLRVWSGAATMPARARTSRGASPGVPWGERSDLSSASRALPCRSVHSTRTHDESRRAASSHVLSPARDRSRPRRRRSSPASGRPFAMAAAGAARRSARRVWLRTVAVEVLRAYHRPPLDRPRELRRLRRDRARGAAAARRGCRRGCSASRIFHPADGAARAGRCRGSTRSATWRRGWRSTSARWSGSPTCAGSSGWSTTSALRHYRYCTLPRTSGPPR